MKEVNTIKGLKEQLRHANDNNDKLANSNTELFHECQMWKAAYEDLVEVTGRETLHPYLTEFNRVIKNLRKRMEKRSKNRGA